MLIAIAWLVFSQFLPVFLRESRKKCSTSPARAYWLENLQFESQAAEKCILYCIMLFSAWQPSQETHFFFLKSEENLKNFKMIVLSCDTVPLKDRLRLPSFSSFFVRMTLSTSVS
jgi:hypothetical protein